MTDITQNDVRLKVTDTTQNCFNDIKILIRLKMTRRAFLLVQDRKWKALSLRHISDFRIMSFNIWS